METFSLFFGCCCLPPSCTHFYYILTTLHYLDTKHIYGECIFTRFLCIIFQAPKEFFKRNLGLPQKNMCDNLHPCDRLHFLLDEEMKCQHGIECKYVTFGNGRSSSSSQKLLWLCSHYTQTEVYSLRKWGTP